MPPSDSLPKIPPYLLSSAEQLEIYKGIQVGSLVSVTGLPEEKLFVVHKLVIWNSGPQAIIVPLKDYNTYTTERHDESRPRFTESDLEAHARMIHPDQLSVVDR